MLRDFTPAICSASRSKKITPHSTAPPSATLNRNTKKDEDKNVQRQVLLRSDSTLRHVQRLDLAARVIDVVRDLNDAGSIPHTLAFVNALHQRRYPTSAPGDDLVFAVVDLDQVNVVRCSDCVDNGVFVDEQLETIKKSETDSFADKHRINISFANEHIYLTIAHKLQLVFKVDNLNCNDWTCTLKVRNWTAKYMLHVEHFFAENAKPIKIFFS